MSTNLSRRGFLGSVALGGAACSGLSYAAAGQAATGNQESWEEIDFLDQRWVEHAWFLSRRVARPERIPEPVIASTNAQSAGTVLPRDGELAFWYTCPQRLEKPDGSLLHYRNTVRYATSSDGRNFQQPELGLREEEGSKRNNIVLAHDEVDAAGQMLNGDGGCSGFCVLDAEAQPLPHVRGRYTALYSASLPRRGGGLCLAYSDDGLHWTAYPENPVRRASSDTYNNFIFDPAAGRYAAYIRPSVHAGPARVNRLVGRVESEDLLHWDHDRVVLDTDDRDAPAQGTIQMEKDTLGYPRGRDRQFYGLTVARCRGLFVGFASFYEPPSGRMWCELVHSYDGLDWRREALREPLIPVGPDGAWDAGMVCFIAAGSPAAVADDWYIYYSGSNYTHHFQIVSLVERGPLRQIGAVRLKRGRLVGYHTGPTESSAAEPEGPRRIPPTLAQQGELLTRCFEFQADGLAVNADAAAGSLAVEICDPVGKPLEGFSRQEAIAIQADGVRLPVAFRNDPPLAPLRGRPVRLRLHLTQASVYGLGFRRDG